MSDIVTYPSCSKRNRVPAAAAGLPAVPPAMRRCRGSSPPATPTSTTRSPPSLGARRPVGAVVRPVPHGRARRGAAACELAGRLKVVKVNVDDAPDVSRRFEARSIPTLLVLRGGRVVARQVGALPANRLVACARTAIGA